MHERITDS